MVQWLAVLLVTALLTACGGGGGSPGQVGGVQAVDPRRLRLWLQLLPCASSMPMVLK
jgi:hypothetical protein